MGKYQFTLEEICLSLIAVNRFYATVLSKMTKIPVKPEIIPTAGVGFNTNGKLGLFYNEDWLLSMPLQKAQGLLIHEVLHVFFRHMTRFPPDPKNPDENMINNVGEDIAINQHIVNLPDEPAPQTPEMYQLEKDKNADYYIEELKKKRQQGGGSGQGGQGQGQGQKIIIRVGGGQGNKELGQTLDSHDLWDKIVDEVKGQVKDVKSNPDFDPEYEVQTTVMKSVMECKDFGNLPSFVKREIEALQAKPRHNWKYELRVFVNTVLTVAKRLSQKRVNRRFAEIVDYILPGKKKSRRPKLLLARDTSGSVFDDKTQAEFQNEMVTISKFADVMVADCDTEVKQVYKVRNVGDFKSYQGGGGTSFEPIFELAKKEGVDGIIYLTDTFGSFPNKENIGKFAAKTIWVTINQKTVELPFGKHVNIDPIK